MAQINKGGRVVGRATPRSTQPEPDKTPRQPIHESIYTSDKEEQSGPDMPTDRDDWSPDVPGDWGQTPEPGNPTADFREGQTIMHKPFKIAWEEPFPRAWPYKDKKHRSEGGTW